MNKIFTGIILPLTMLLKIPIGITLRIIADAAVGVLRTVHMFIKEHLKIHRQKAHS